MRILLTGGAGFIGSHLAQALLERGAELILLDNLEGEEDRKLANLVEARLIEPQAQVAQVRGDVRDAGLLGSLLPGVDAVIHLAALAGVRDSLADPMRYEAVNVQGTMILLEAMRAAGCGRLVFASSSSVYGARAGEGGFREDEPADRPVSPYAATKRMGELACHVAASAWGLQVQCLRFFTVYGPRQRPSMAISRFIELALADRPLPLFGDGSSLRDYTYVDDVVRGVLAALDRPQGFQIYNLGCGAPIRLDRLVGAVEQAVGRPVRVERLPEQPGDVPRTHADIERARRELDWQPRVGIEQGLEATVRWWRERMAGR